MDSGNVGKHEGAVAELLVQQDLVHAGLCDLHPFQARGSSKQSSRYAHAGIHLSLREQRIQHLRCFGVTIEFGGQKLADVRHLDAWVHCLDSGNHVLGNLVVHKHVDRFHRNRLSSLGCGAVVAV